MAARAEACQLRIEQRTEQELELGEKSLSEIGRTIAAEIQKLFEATVNPDAIRIRAARIKARTNVQATKTPVTTRVEGGDTGDKFTPQEVVREVDAIVKKGKSVREAAKEVAEASAIRDDRNGEA